MTEKYTTEKFIELAKVVHGDLYDYSRVNYISSTTKVDVVCKTHGVFSVRPAMHLSGQKCIKCQGKDQLTLERFLVDANKKHNSRFSYKNVTSISGNKCRIYVTCPEHGDWATNPNNHLRGGTCPKCLGRHKNLDIFITQAREVHGDSYDYSRTVYSGANKHLAVSCRTHGVFQILPNNHLHGHACPSCGGSKQLDTVAFISAAVKKHGGKYSYEKVDYVNSKTHVIISCKEHGEFKQTPNSHMRGQGCPSCAEYGFNSSKAAWVYVVVLIGEDKNHVGYGITGRPRARMFEHKMNAAAHGFDIERVLMVKHETGINARAVENALRLLPKSELPIPGFKTENTTIENLINVAAICC